MTTVYVLMDDSDVYGPEFAYGRGWVYSTREKAVEAARNRVWGPGPLEGEPYPMRPYLIEEKVIDGDMELSV